MIRDLMKEEEWHEFDQYKNLIPASMISTLSMRINLVPRESRDIKGRAFSLRVNRTTQGRRITRLMFESANFTECYNDEGASQITEADFHRTLTVTQTTSRSTRESETSGFRKRRAQSSRTRLSSRKIWRKLRESILLIPTSLTGKDTNPLYPTSSSLRTRDIPPQSQPDRHHEIRTTMFSNEA